MLHRYGTDEQKEHWLLPMVDGKVFPSVGLTEPEVAGSDPTLMQSTARSTATSGSSTRTSGSPPARERGVHDRLRRDRPRRAGARPFSTIIVPTDTPGYEIVRVIPTMGYTRAGHCEIRLTDVRVPAATCSARAARRSSSRSAARAGPHLPLHALARAGAARVRADVRARQERGAHGSLLADKGGSSPYVAESAAQIQAHG